MPTRRRRARQRPLATDVGGTGIECALVEGDGEMVGEGVEMVITLETGLGRRCVGGGNAELLKGEMPPRVKRIDRAAGILGGHRP
jgi:hypothetical protein